MAGRYTLTRIDEILMVGMAGLVWIQASGQEAVEEMKKVAPESGDHVVLGLWLTLVAVLVRGITDLAKWWIAKKEERKKKNGGGQEVGHLIAMLQEKDKLQHRLMEAFLELDPESSRAIELRRAIKEPSGSVSKP